MAVQRNIFGKVADIDDSNAPAWILVLESGWKIHFPGTVSHEKFEDGDNVLIGFDTEGLGYLASFRDRRLMTSFLFGEACRIEKPEDEVVYSGDYFTAKLVGDGDDLVITHKTDEQVGLSVYPVVGDKPMIAVEPRLHSVMQIGDSSHGPRIKVIKEN